jgi:hypothetical protein
MRHRFDASPPVTLNEKILFKMAFDRRPILKTLADRIAVRDYVQERVGGHVLPKHLHVFSDADELLGLNLRERPAMWWVFGVVAGIERVHRGNLGEFFQELERRPTMARTNDALSVEDLLATSGGMQGLKDVLSTVVQDALRSHSRPR